MEGRPWPLRGAAPSLAGTLVSRAGQSRYDPWDYFTASPLVDGDRAFVGAPDRDGDEERWQFKTRGSPDFPRGEVQGSAAVPDGDIVVGSRDYRLYRLDGATGTLEWEYEDPSWLIAGPLVDGPTLFVGSSDSHRAYAIDAASKSVRWSTDLEANVFGSAAVWNDLVIFPTTEVYSADDKGFLFGLDRAAGVVRWRIRPGGNVRSTPVVSGNRVFVGSESGTVSAWQLHPPP